MLRLPLIATAVVAAVIALLLPLLADVHVLVAVIAAISVVVGAWCAPTTYGQDAHGSLIGIWREVWTPRMARLKALQLLVAGAGTAGLVLMGVLEPGVAGIVGIALALTFGVTGDGARSRD